MMSLNMEVTEVTEVAEVKIVTKDVPEVPWRLLTQANQITEVAMEDTEVMEASVN